MKYYCYILILIVSACFTACEDNERERERDSEKDNNTESINPLPSVKPVGQKIIFNIDGNYIRAGNKKTGKVVYTIDGDYIRAGQGSEGDIVYTIDGMYIRIGKAELQGDSNAKNDILFIFDGTYIRPIKSSNNMYEVKDKNISIAWNKGTSNDQNRIFTMNITYGTDLTYAHFSSLDGGGYLYYMHPIYRTDRGGKELAGARIYKMGNAINDIPNSPDIYYIEFDNPNIRNTRTRVYAGTKTPDSKPICTVVSQFSKKYPSLVSEAIFYVGDSTSPDNYLYTMLIYSYVNATEIGQVYAFY